MTARLARIFAFPLLGKELTEAAARRRTYVVRAFYAVLLYVVFAALMPRWLWSASTSPLQAMGAGRELFEQLWILQTCGIALFLPALMCGRIAQEKERDSLVLLLLTELKPWQIVLQKYAGGLVPMLSFLLLGMPLAAVAYAFGGVTVWTLVASLYALLVTCLQAGALALFCSAWCRTTVGAFLAAYFIGAVLYAGPIVALVIARNLRLIGSYSPDFEWSFVLIPAFGAQKIAEHFDLLAGSGGMAAARFALAAGSAPSYSLLLGPPLLSTALFLFLARAVLVRRAFTPPSHFFVRIFRRLDALMKRSNHLVGNVMLVRESENLPGDAPIYWRETSRRVLGKMHYLLRILVVVEIPTVFLCALSSDLGYAGNTEELSVLAAFLCGLAAIGISVQAANSIVSERVQQTLEVLLTTPLSGRQIVLEKAAALRRLAIVAAIPLLTVFGSECWIEADLSSDPDVNGALAYAVCTLLLMVILLTLITWLSLWVGLRVRTRFRAIVTALVVLVLWCGLPILLMILLVFADGYEARDPLWIRSISLLSPVTVGILNESGSLQNFPWELQNPWPVIIANAAFYGAITWLIRRHTLRHADRWLRR